MRRRACVRSVGSCSQRGGRLFRTALLMTSESSATAFAATSRVGDRSILITTRFVLLIPRVREVRRAFCALLPRREAPPLAPRISTFSQERTANSIPELRGRLQILKWQLKCAGFLNPTAKADINTEFSASDTATTHGLLGLRLGRGW